MWNRVALLILGMAFGWSLAHYWSAPTPRLSTQRTRLIASLVLTVIMVAVLASRSLAAGVAAVLVFAFSAAVAYAGNAKQVAKVETDTLAQPQPARPMEWDNRVAVVLVAGAEPARYEGPDVWARRLAKHEIAPPLLAHWLARPRQYGRIRAAYEAIGGQHPTDAHLKDLAARVTERLGEGFMASVAYIESPPLLRQHLADLAAHGTREIALLPLECGENARAVLRGQVTISRAREIGVGVHYAAPLDAGQWPWPTQRERLVALLGSGALVDPGALPDETVEAVATAVRATFGA